MSNPTSKTRLSQALTDLWMWGCVFLFCALMVDCACTGFQMLGGGQ